MKDTDTIAPVVRRDLCTQCGTCAAVCPSEAIVMRLDSKRGRYRPEIDTEKCNRCGLCLRVCPGHEVDFAELNRSVFATAAADTVLGHYLGCYSGHALDESIRYNGASGGMVTGLLVHALEEGLIDGALVTRMKPDAPLEPEPFIARTRDEIVAAARSKYCPVAANTALREILRAEGRYAVVGLPCHLHGIRKAEADNAALRSRISLHVGIFCGHSPSFRATEYLLRHQGIPAGDVIGIDYRGGGWPGNITIRRRQGDSVTIPYVEAWKTLDLAFTPWRCLLCRDGAAELADISCGDAWLDDFSGDGSGTSAIITRTAAAEDILKGMVDAGRAMVRRLEPDRVAASQQSFENKNVYPWLYRRCARIIFKKTPSYGICPEKPDLARLVNASLRLLGYLLSSRRCLWRLIPVLPGTLIPVLGRLRRLLTPGSSSPR